LSVAVSDTSSLVFYVLAQRRRIVAGFAGGIKGEVRHQQQDLKRSASGDSNADLSRHVRR
jgi:hypothetical protein